MINGWQGRRRPLSRPLLTLPAPVPKPAIDIGLLNAVNGEFWARWTGGMEARWRDACRASDESSSCMLCCITPHTRCTRCMRQIEPCKVGLKHG